MEVVQWQLQHTSWLVCKQTVWWLRHTSSVHTRPAFSTFKRLASRASHRSRNLSAVLQDKEVRKWRCVGGTAREREDRLGCP
jgi:hypothetical protein